MLGTLAGGISEPDGSSEPGKFAQAAQIVSYSSTEFTEFGVFLSKNSLLGDLCASVVRFPNSRYE